MDQVGLHRSYLYVVGHRADQIEKAYRTNADAIVLELEDAVAPSQKDEARRTVARVLERKPPKPTYVRVNPVGTGLTRADLETVALGPIEGIRIAKASSPADVYAVGRWLQDLGSSAGIQLLLESAAAVEQAGALARAHPSVMGIALGEQDLRADIGASDEGLLYARSRVVIAARAAGLPPPYQSVWTAVGDLDGLRETSREGKRLGFFGRSAIHPAQIDVINAVYTPSDEEIAEAEALERRLEEAVDAGSAGIKLPDGRFIDNAVVLAARRTLAFGRRAQGR